MKIFFVHGIGHADLDQNYYVQWETDVYGSTQILRSESVNTHTRVSVSTAITQSDATEKTPAAFA